MMDRRILLTFAAGLLLLASIRPSRGAGFAIAEQSVRGMGAAYAGGTAAPEDPSAVFFNPAGLTEVEGRQAAAGLHVIMPDFEFEDDGSSYPLLGIPLAGGNGGNGGELALVPNLYCAHPVSSNLSVGVGLMSPYGLVTEYDDGWKGRYHGIKTDLRNLNLNPALGWKLNDRLSFGAGLSASYVDAELTSAIDFGGILAGRGVAGAAPQMLDGAAKLEGDDWGYGFNAGLLYELCEDTRLGLNYRSEIEHSLCGEATFEVPPQAAALKAAGAFVDTHATADVTLPQTASLGIARDLGEAWRLFVDVTWTGWSSFEELRVDYDSAQPDSVTEEKWDDTWRYALGVSHACSTKWTLRAGTAYDETPIPDKEHRTPRIPDGDRVWLTLGAGYQLAEHCMIDAGYIHVFFKDTEVDLAGATGDNLAGTYEGRVDVASLQLTWDF